jgi:hypothetical protein
VRNPSLAMSVSSCQLAYLSRTRISKAMDQSLFTVRCCQRYVTTSLLCAEREKPRQLDPESRDLN